ncbi:MAG: PRTRC system protein D [Paraburkholderia tropica]|nr:PRTRC system protein D [Paraburkholderia tropica]
MKTPVFAIDVGYGFTKYAYRSTNGSEKTAMFPSLAPPAACRAPLADSERMLTARNVVTISIDSVEYEVGPDIPITAAYGRTGRSLVDDYALSDNYAALLFGAIHFAGVTHIDCLVLGLAVHNLERHAAELKERFVGEFNFGPGRVEIGKVAIIPQPLGSLALAANGIAGGFQRDDAYLVVDVGYFTTDWLYANAFMIDSNRSGGISGGTSQIYQRIAGLISRDEGEEVDDIERIDKALRENMPFFFYGKSINLAPYVALVAPIISNVVAEIQNCVGRLTDVRSIILTGGGAALYATAIRRAFPRVRVEIINSPSIANARGFLVVGETGLTRERRAAKTTTS